MEDYSQFNRIRMPPPRRENETILPDFQGIKGQQWVEDMENNNKNNDSSRKTNRRFSRPVHFKKPEGPGKKEEMTRGVKSGEMEEGRNEMDPHLFQEYRSHEDQIFNDPRFSSLGTRVEFDASGFDSELIEPSMVKSRGGLSYR